VSGPDSNVPIPVRVFTSVFGVIGVAVLIYMGSAPSAGFGAPPTFFRIFASLIGIAFIAFSLTPGSLAACAELALTRKN